MADRVHPLVTASEPAWLGAIAIKGIAAPFDLIGPAATVGHAGDGLVSFDGVKLERSLAEHAARDPYPIPVPADREGYYGERHYDYWLSGLYDYLAARQALRRFGRDLDAGDGVFELGCASGRVLRHFACQMRDLDLWGADINLRHVEWIRNFLPPSIKVFQNTALPHLPLEDRSLALLLAFSVFTHIDELELAWLAEVRRVLKPGGIAYVTVHSEKTWSKMGPGLSAFEYLMAVRQEVKDYEISPELFRSAMPAGKVIFSWKQAANYNSSVFHHSDYIRSTWGRFLRVRETVEGGHNYQDVIVLQRET